MQLSHRAFRASPFKILRGGGGMEKKKICGGGGPRNFPFRPPLRISNGIALSQVTSCRYNITVYWTLDN